MKTKRNFLYEAAILLICIPSLSFAQVPKKVVVEHFTNTLCSNCASRNPGFYSNLNNQTGVIHIAFHPSSPYAACIFNKHNVAQNDARTNFYGLYGGTPRYVIQGDHQTGDVSKASVFTPYLNQTSEVGIQIDQMNNGVDPLEIKVTIDADEDNSLGNVKLFVALVEKLINYDAPNGEDKHHDVFRLALTSAEGDDVSIPATAGQTVEKTFKSAVDSEWKLSEMYALVILQDPSTKDVIQSEAGASNAGLVGLDQIEEKSAINIYPNPASDLINFSNLPSESRIQVYNTQGQLVYSNTPSNSDNSLEIPTAGLSTGMHIIEIITDQAIQRQKILIK